MQILMTPFVWVLMFFYDIFGSYGFALIFFALVVKLILFPFSLKGKKGMIQTNMLQGQMTKLQKMYGNNKERYNQEVQKLYAKEKVNPMSGCLWSFLPILVLFPLYAIVREPLTYVMNLSAEQITALLGALPVTIDQSNVYFQMEASHALTQSFSAVVGSPAVAAFKDNLQALNFDFFRINLAQFPNWKFWEGGISWNSIGLLLLPIISAVSGLLYSLISMKTNAINSSTQTNNATSKMMMIVSPLMSLWIGFIMPGAMSIYWIANNLFSMLQEFAASKMLKKDYEKAAADQARREAEEKEEEKRQKELERQERAKRIEEAKLTKKKPAAKKKDGEDIPAAVKEASREGIRAYARGRAYDPARFSPDGPTPYQAAQAAQLEKTEKAEDFIETISDEHQAEAAEETADALIVESILAEQAQEALPKAEENSDSAPEAEDAPAFETPKYDTPHYDAPDDDAQPKDGGQ